MIAPPNPIQTAARARTALQQSVEASASEALRECLAINTARARRPSLNTLGPDEPTVKTQAIRAPG
jgi:hypothetical protein